MGCPSCGQENPEGVRFCGECGASLQAAVTCPHCGTSNPQSVKFCHECGQRLAGAAPSTPTPTPSPAIPASFASGRYQVRRFLGEGGKKRVYLAHDTRLDSDVAIALIKTEGLEKEGLTRIRREAQAMGRLRDHPHIVTVLDIGDEAGQPYIVQEHMEGGSLEEWLQGAEDQRPSLGQSLLIAKQVCQALEHAHGRGIIHRDLKPGNIFLTRTRDAKLGDFGLARVIGQARISAQGMMVGTSLYMPPEQALGGEATARSDLYSLGCVLYEMVTGRPPFVGDDPTAVISQHVNTPPVAPSWYSDHCPPDLEELILRLLAKDPEDRPGSATEVVSVLERVDPTQKSAPREQANVLERLARGVFVGREQELERLRKAFDSAFSGRGGIVMLVGEPGIGKTRTAEELETYARMRGAQVLWGVAHESAGAPAYWPWVQVGRSYGLSRDLAELGPDTQGVNAELVRIFPELAQMVPDIGEPKPVTDPDSAQFRLFDAYATFVRAMANQTPLLIALDDLHWADKPSLLLLRHLARELSRMRVLVVGTYRDTELARTHPLAEALAVLNRESGFQRIVLRGLSREEVAAYIQAVANVKPKRELLERIYEETEGNPFFLSEVVSLLTQEGALTKESVSDIAVPDGVREALGRRLDRISEEANELLQMAAVAGREFAYETLTLLGEHGEEELLRLVEEGLQARVIEEMERPGHYRFTHALMQETLLSELSTTRRVRLHGQIGEALEQRWGERAKERASRLAQHFVEAAMLTPRHAEKAVYYSKLAAEQAEGQSAWDLAARQYEHCLALVTEAEDGLGEDEAALLAAHGVCARNAGDYRISWRSLMRAITLYQQRGDATAMARTTLEAAIVWTPGDRWVALAQRALAALGDGDPYLEARLLACLWAPDLARLLDSKVAERVRRRASELAEQYGFEDVRAQILYADGFDAFETGDWERAASLFWEAYERFAGQGLVGQASNAFFVHVYSLLYRGSLQEALAKAEEGLAYARDHGIRFLDEVCAACVAAILLARCDFRAFDALAEEHAYDVSYAVPALRASRAEAAGELTRAIALLPDLSAAGGVPVYLAQIHAVRARVLLNAGRVGEAQQEFSWMCESLRDFPLAESFDGMAFNFHVLGALDEALPALGGDAYMRGVDSLGVVPAIDFAGRNGYRILADLSLHLGQTAEAERRFQAALDWAERERCPIEAGRCLQGLAEVAERRGNLAEALRYLDRASVLFQQHGAKLYLNQAIGKKVKLQGIESGEISSSIGAVAAMVETEEPDLRPHAAPDGTVTILFSDIEGSTVITERLGDQRWLELLRSHNATVRECLQAHNGYEVKTEGDGFMLAFSSARRALQCAVAIQRAFAQHNETADEPIRVRIGLHTGEAVKEAEDFYGKHVILASRIAAQAQGGEILVSSLLKELTESAGDIAFGEEHEVELKGLKGKQRVFEVVWEQA